VIEPCLTLLTDKYMVLHLNEQLLAVAAPDDVSRGPYLLKDCLTSAVLNMRLMNAIMIFVM